MALFFQGWGKEVLCFSLVLVCPQEPRNQYVSHSPLPGTHPVIHTARLTHFYSPFRPQFSCFFFLPVTLPRSTKMFGFSSVSFHNPLHILHYIPLILLCIKTACWVVPWKRELHKGKNCFWFPYYPYTTKTSSILIKYLTNFSDGMLLNYFRVEFIIKSLSVTFYQAQF